MQRARTKQEGQEVLPLGFLRFKTWNITIHFHEFTRAHYQFMHNSRLLQHPKWSVTECNGCNDQA